MLHFFKGKCESLSLVEAKSLTPKLNWRNSSQWKWSVLKGKRHPAMSTFWYCHEILIYYFGLSLQGSGNAKDTGWSHLSYLANLTLLKNHRYINFLDGRGQMLSMMRCSQPCTTGDHPWGINCASSWVPSLKIWSLPPSISQHSWGQKLKLDCWKWTLSCLQFVS